MGFMPRDEVDDDVLRPECWRELPNLTALREVGQPLEKSAEVQK